MLPRSSGVSSALKRKHTEYIDPDYPNSFKVLPNGNVNNQLGKQGHDDLATDGHESKAEVDEVTESRLKRLRRIISREFQMEIDQKQAQIQEIDERIVQARNLLDRLRYAIVADYYQKQEIPLSAAEAAAIRGKETACDDEVLGPQMPLHPSIKKIIGAKTCDFKEILKPCPVRAAAQNAKSTIRLKTAEQRRKERRQQQALRAEGFVIDHSKSQKGNNTEASHVTALTSNTPRNDTPSAGKALNATRINNKQKHILIVGNTSKYIGGEVDSEPISGLHGRITHKWLVYIKTKNHAEPLEKFVSKVRFFLHASYRPNNIVDICEPPYQFSRRGWGEFPLRIQLFFHEHLKQKPIQLVHNIVLDKSLCGLQTMGAETMLEIWLPKVDAPIAEPKVERNASCLDVAPLMAKPRTISITHNKEELDDNLFKFLADIDQTPTSVCADIEKLQPTVMVTEPYTTASTTISAAPHSSQAGGGTLSLEPRNGSLFDSSSAKAAADFKADNHGQQTAAQHFAREMVAAMKASSNHKTALAAPYSSQDTKPKSSILSVAKKSPNQPPASAPKTLIIDRVANGNVVPPTMASSPSTSGGSRLVSATSTGDKLGPQRRVVQLKDRDGNVKYIQMLMAGPKVAPQPKDAASSQVAESPNSVQVKSQVATTSKSAGSSSITGQKNMVFQREGKLFIIDPVQTKLKQQQRKQVSLLKPQVSLLKQQHQQSQAALQNMTIAYRNVVEDHNYTPRQPLKQHNTPQTVTSANDGGPQTIAKLRLPTTPPPLHYGIRQTRVNATHLHELQQRLRQQMEQQFFRETFHSTRSAVDYLLRRIPLVAAKDSVAVAYPFVRNTLREYEALPAIKRRSCEWLRAKHIGRLMGQHKQLQRNEMWSTREIMQYSRVNAYTPCNLNALVQSEAQTVGGFSVLVKNELRQEESSWHYDTLTAALSIKRWIHATWEQLQRHDESTTLITEIIDVDGSEQQPRNNTPSGGQTVDASQRNDIICIRPPERLYNEITVLSGICKDLDVRLQPEEVVDGVMCPLAQTVMAQALRILLEKLIRQSVAGKLTKPAADLPTKGIMQLHPHDISRVIANSRDGEYDFLTKHNFGVAASEHSHKTEESQPPQLDTKSPVQS